MYNIIKTSNAKCSQFVEGLLLFKANNIFSEYTSNSTATLYVVYSWGKHFPMFICSDGKWYENSDKYSQSTSKQQTQARPSANFVLKTTDELLKMINK
jgi:hypothetical protein